MAYLSVDEMRQEIKKAYPGVGWARKVSCMYDAQVIAIYYKFLADGKFDRKPLSINKKEEKEINSWFDQTFTEENECLQIDFSVLM